jgi:hypothetical protein
MHKPNASGPNRNDRPRKLSANGSNRTTTTRSAYERQSQQYQALPPSPERTPSPATERLQPIHTGNDLYSAHSDGMGNTTTAANLQCLLYIGDVPFGGKVVKFRKNDGESHSFYKDNLAQIQRYCFLLSARHSWSSAH